MGLDDLDLFMLKLKDNRPNKNHLGQYYSLVKTMNTIFESDVVKFDGTFLEYNRKLLVNFMKKNVQGFVITSFERKLRHFKMQVVQTTHGPNAVKKWSFK